MWTICKNCDASNSTSQKNVLLALANSIKLEFWCFGYRLQNFQRKRAHSWHLNQQCLQKSESLASVKKWRATSHLYFLNLIYICFFSDTFMSGSVLEFGWSIAVLNFQNKILGPAGPQVFIFGHQNKNSSRLKLYLRTNAVNELTSS